MSNAEWFGIIEKSLIDMQFTEDEMDAIWSMTSASLLIGEIEIDDSNYDGNAGFEK